MFALWWVKALIVVAALSAAAAGGATVNGWRLHTQFAEELREKDKRISEQDLQIEKQNGAVELLRQSESFANESRQRAEKEASAQRAASKKRDDWISKLSGTCDQNLKEMWGRL